ncbi:MAG: TetR family transcriptional regulator [Nevskiaceae bacterium]
MLTRHQDRVRARARYARETRGQGTRQALLDAALDLLEGGRSFGSLSLREITRAVGIVPAAFYRHFRDVEELGLALVDESMSTLRRMIREARETPLEPERIIRRSVETLVRHVHANRRHFRLISREMHGGMPALRERIRREIQSFTSELALDLGRLPWLNRWSAEDLRMIAGLMVNAMVQIAEEILEAPAGGPQAEEEVIRVAEKQLLLISLGVPQWRPADPAAPAAPAPIG